MSQTPNLKNPIKPKKKPIKPNKTQKKTKKPTGLGFFLKTRVFSNPVKNGINGYRKFPT
jgi:hypothetical protein